MPFLIQFLYRYTKLAELKNDKVQKFAIDQVDGGSIAEDMVVFSVLSV